MNTAALVQTFPKPRRRRHFRFVCRNEAKIKVGSAQHKIRVCDASDAGACVEVDQDCILKPGTVVEMEWAAIKELKKGSSDGHCLITGTIVRADAPGRYGVRFDRMVHEHLLARSVRLQKFCIGTVIAALIGLICYMKARNILYFWYEPWLQAYSVGAAVFILTRMLVSMRYKEPPDRGYYPKVSIIIAGKNEESHIAPTIDHCFQSHYPPDLIEVFAIDDGSTDKTWEIMKGLEDKYPQLTAHRFEKNKGKRHAMGWGAEQATGDILVYVDSDSYIDPDALYKIVQPFADENIGAVSGHVLVAVEEDNFISKMEAIRYYISHRIMKAAESVFGAVTCCPGAFSAYRRKTVMKILPAWLNQRFWGTAATFGDDRSLTNFVLRTNDVIYHSGALCLTYVPRTLMQFFKQQLRWKKSWSRETTVAVRLMYKKHPVAAIFYYLGVMLTLVSPLIAMRSLLFFPFFPSAGLIPYVIGVFLVYTLMCLFCLYWTQSRYWYYGLAFAALYLVALSFQNYYAIATIHKNHWGTR